MTAATATAAGAAHASAPVIGQRHGPYFVVGPMTAQDGARVYGVVRGCPYTRRLLVLEEYMSQTSALQEAAARNALAQAGGHDA